MFVFHPLIFPCDEVIPGIRAMLCMCVLLSPERMNVKAHFTTFLSCYFYYLNPQKKTTGKVMVCFTFP